MRSKLVALIVILLGVFMGMLAMEFRQELRITHSQKADEIVARTAAFAVAWLIFYGMVPRWAGTSRRRSAGIGLVCPITWVALALTAITIDRISFV